MTTDLDLNVEYISVDHLIPYAKNARTHSDDQVAQIAGSMTEFGFVNPILIGDDGGIIAGHGRVMAARMLGVKEVPAIRLKHLTEVQRRALIIADNKIAENAGWNDELLRQELQALDGDEFDLGLLGFNDDELEAFLNGDADG
jgi:ParB-like chromosome segregation protein Spo0J